MTKNNTPARTLQRPGGGTESITPTTMEDFCAQNIPDSENCQEVRLTAAENRLITTICNAWSVSGGIEPGSELDEDLAAQVISMMKRGSLPFANAQRRLTALVKRMEQIRFFNFFVERVRLGGERSAYRLHYQIGFDGGIMQPKQTDTSASILTLAVNGREISPDLISAFRRENGLTMPYLAVKRRWDIHAALLILDALEPFQAATARTTAPKKAAPIVRNYLFPSGRGFDRAFFPQSTGGDLFQVLKSIGSDEIAVESGYLYIGKKRVMLQQLQPSLEIPNYDLSLLAALYRLRIEQTDGRAATFTVPVEAFSELTGRHYGGNYLTATDGHRSLSAELKALENLIAWRGGRFWRVLFVRDGNATNQTLTLEVPFLDDLITELRQKSPGKPQTALINGNHNALLHPNAESIGKAPFEMAVALTNGLLQRGTDSKNPRTVYRVKFSELVNKSYTLTRQLAEAGQTKTPTQTKNGYLKRAFSGLYRLLRDYSDCYNYFQDLEIVERVPTVSDLKNGAVLEVTFAGKNKTK